MTDKDLTPEAVAALSDKLMLSARAISASKETCEAIDLASRVMPALAAKLAEVEVERKKAMGEFDAKCKEANEQRSHRIAAEAENAQLRAENAQLRDALLRWQNYGCPDCAGVMVANYERLAKLDPDTFGAVILDESSILKSYASKTLAYLLRTHPTPTVRVDFTDGPDRPAYWPTDKKPKPPKPDTRAKIKAARKQRRKNTP